MIGAIIAMNIALEAQRRAEEAEQEARLARREAQRRVEGDERRRTWDAQGYGTGVCRMYTAGDGRTCRIYGIGGDLTCLRQ